MKLYSKKVILTIGLIGFSLIYKRNYLSCKSNESVIYDPLWRSKIRKPLAQDISEKNIKNEIVLLKGTNNSELANEVADRLALPLSNVVITKNQDREISIKINCNLEGKQVFIIHSVAPPVNESLIELLFLIAEAKRAGASNVKVVVPYLGYSTQTQSLDHRKPIFSADIATMFKVVGADDISTIELHSGQIEGFYNIHIDNISSLSILCEYLYNSNLIHSFKDLIIVSPDANGVRRAKDLSDIIGKTTGIPINMAFASNTYKKLNHKKKSLVTYDNYSNEEETQTVIIGNINGNDCIIIDDLMKSGKTMIETSYELKKQGAKSIIAYTPHCIILI